MNSSELAAYLGRIDAPHPGGADPADSAGPADGAGSVGALRALHRAHLMTVPFENLSIHLGEPISLAAGDLIDKIVTRRRGGFCYELNGAFALLLGALGFEVRLLAARVFGGGRLGPPFDHLALLVHTSDGDGPWLADVGFGSHSVTRCASTSGSAGRSRRQLPAGRRRRRGYRRDQGRSAAIPDRAARRGHWPTSAPTCWWQQTSPDSHFTRSTVCSRVTDDGRVSISGRTLIRTADGNRTEEELPTDAAVLAAYRDHFGIILGQVPAAPGMP